MGIFAIAEAQHQPGAAGATGFGPINPATDRSHHSRIYRAIYAVHPGQRKNAAEVFDPSQILVASPTDQLDPAT
jgi:hypothetical protein